MWMTTALPAAKHWKRSCSWAGSEMNLGTLAFLDSVFCPFHYDLRIYTICSHVWTPPYRLHGALLSLTRTLAIAPHCSRLLPSMSYILHISMLLAAYCMPLLPSRASLLPGAVKATGSQVPRCWLPSGRVTSCFQAQAGLWTAFKLPLRRLRNFQRFRPVQSPRLIVKALRRSWGAELQILQEHAYWVVHSDYGAS